MSQDNLRADLEDGAPLRGTGSREPDQQAVPALTGFDPARAENYERLIEFCECASNEGQPYALREVANFLFDPAKRTRIEDLIVAEAYLDAAVTILPEGAIWRRYTDNTAAVYAASPYNAAAQVRYDGLSRLPAMAICAALLRMKLAAVVQKAAAEARKVSK